MNVPALPFTVFPRRTKVFGLLVLSLVFVGGAVLMVLEGRKAGWLWGGFFGLCALVFTVQLHPRSSFLTVSEAGLEFSSLFRKRFVRWSDISEFGVYTIRQHGLAVSRFVGFNYSAGRLRSTKARRISKALAGFEGGLPDTYGYRAEELAALLAHIHSERMQPRNA
jgi:hypothetical protein